MNRNFICQGLESYVVLEAEDGEDYEYKMLFSNEIPYLLPVRMDAVNQKGSLIYRATGYRPLQEIYEKQWIRYDDLQWIITSITGVIESVKQYLLLPDSLLLLPDTVFLDKDKGDIRFLYAPGHQEGIEKQMKNFSEYLMERIDPKNVEGVVLIWRIYMLLKEGRGSLSSIKQCLVEKTEEEPMKRELLPGSGKSRFRMPEIPDILLFKNKWHLGKVLLGGIFFVLLIAGAVLLYHIYYFGILEWKRNCLLILVVLLAADSIAFWWVFQNDRKERKMKDLFCLK